MPPDPLPAPAGMTRLDAIRARLAANPHASYPELVDPWPAYVAWLVETVETLDHGIRVVEPLMLRALLGDNPTAVEWQRVGKPLRDALARLEELE